MAGVVEVPLIVTMLPLGMSVSTVRCVGLAVEMALMLKVPTATGTVKLCALTLVATRTPSQVGAVFEPLITTVVPVGTFASQSISAAAPDGIALKARPTSTGSARIVSPALACARETLAVNRVMRASLCRVYELRQSVPRPSRAAVTGRSDAHYDLKNVRQSLAVCRQNV